MRKMLKYLPVIAMVTAVTSVAGCGEGVFVGPPGGSIVGSPGLYPTMGLTPPDFLYEDPTVTDIYNDVWYIDPGRDSNEGPGGLTTIPTADAINAMQMAGFTDFIVGGSGSAHAPEVNVVWPIMLSFMSQWYHRNGDGSRKSEMDIFGQLVWSTASLDINFVTGTVVFVPPNRGPLWEVVRSADPFAGTGQPMSGWSAPTPASPGSFPSPQQVYSINRFSECGVVLLKTLLASGTPVVTQGLGLPITDNPNNDQVENMGTIPQSLGGGAAAVPNPTGTFGDVFADDYRVAPVFTPFSLGHTEDEAAIEYARHFGCVHAQLVAQAVGLNSIQINTIMDPAQVVWQNGFGYSFIQNDLDALANVHLPGRGRDPRIP
ncbi:hypothetical protein OAU50_04925 [Planctomycetota bacterium]|nr:hypothetical protein [Planctomycetota bacterium]